MKKIANEQPNNKPMPMKTSSPDHHEAIITVSDLKKNFKVGNNLIRALGGVNLTIKATDFCVIYGPSGCGKTTLINTIAGIDTPSSGEIEIRDTNIFDLDDDQRGIFRSKKMGIIHQLSSWVKSLDVLENVALPLIIEGEDERHSKIRAKRVMRELGILDLSKQIPTQLSGGQQQRVAVGRALVANPWILLADEPTGNLDTKTSDEIIAIFDMLNKEYKRTIILVTHNQAYWTLGTRAIEMRDGLIVKDTKS